jgi:hypothetical protein
MIKGALSAKLAGCILAVAVGAAVGGFSTPAAALPTTWILQNAVLDDGGTATGVFTLNVYGFLSPPTHIDTTAGSLLGAYTYTVPGSPSSIIPSSPPAYGVAFYSGNYDRALHLEFTNSLEGSGVNQLVLKASYECASFSCPGLDTGQIGADTRYFVSGYAVAAVPEPGTLGLMMAALGVFGAMAASGRSRQRTGVQAV